MRSVFDAIFKEKNEAKKWNGVEKKGTQNLQVESFEVVRFNAADQMLVERASYANEGYYFFPKAMP